MPVLGHFESAGETEQRYADFRFSRIGVAANGAVTNQEVIALVPDFTEVQDEASASKQLRDIVEGQTWQLNRIVGKWHISVAPAPGAPTEVWPNVYIVAGFFVARSDDNNQGVTGLTAQEMNPADADNIMNPWIWRRSWVLGNRGYNDPTGFSESYFQNANSEYGSVADGPHIDSKVKRYIPREHRLWAVLSVRGYDPGSISVSNATPQPEVSAILDVRVHGSMRRAKNQSSF